MSTKTRLNDLQIALRLTDDERAQAFAMAEAEGRTTGNFVRQVYRLGLQQYLKQKPVSRVVRRVA